jgi:hypothetical protein
MMRHLPTLVFLALLLPLLPGISPAGAQSARPANLTLAQVERNAVDLKHGMSVEEVERLLGKPRRTALKDNGSSTNAPSQGTLQWTYAWAASAPSSLHVQFGATTPEQWYVKSWEWSTY